MFLLSLLKKLIHVFDLTLTICKCKQDIEIPPRTPGSKDQREGITWSEWWRLGGHFYRNMMLLMKNVDVLPVFI